MDQTVTLLMEGQPGPLVRLDHSCNRMASLRGLGDVGDSHYRAVAVFGWVRVTNVGSVCRHFHATTEVYSCDVGDLVIWCRRVCHPGVGPAKEKSGLG